MPKISGVDRHQLTFSSLEATIATDNDVRFTYSFSQYPRKYRVGNDKYQRSQYSCNHIS